MKSIFGCIFCICFANQANSQSFFLKQNKKAKPHTNLNGYLMLKAKTAIPQVADTARFSHSIPQGNVYIMPQDNMPCVVDSAFKRAGRKARSYNFFDRGNPLALAPKNELNKIYFNQGKPAGKIPNTIQQVPLFFEQPTFQNQGKQEAQLF